MDRRTVGWLLVVAQFALLLVLVLLPRRPLAILPLIIGLLLVAAAVVLGLRAGQRLGGALTPNPVPIGGAGLRTTGVYEQVRHPIYSAVLLGVLGYCIALGSWWSWAWAAVITAFFWAKSRWEDRLLHEEYGAAWMAWARRTGALVPRLGRRQ